MSCESPTIAKLPEELSDLAGRLIPYRAGEKPGDAQAEDVPTRPSAVLVLLYERDDEVRLVLTARPGTLSRHGGQISLPGGGYEAQDTDLWQTALRETREELGIDSHGIQPLGRLEDLPMRVTEFVISPFVAWMERVPAIQEDPNEVEEVIEIPLRWLTQTARIATEEWTHRNQPYEVTFYQFGERVVWGATARILWDLAVTLRPGLDEIEPAPGAVIPVSQGSREPQPDAGT